MRFVILFTLTFFGHLALAAKSLQEEFKEDFQLKSISLTKQEIIDLKFKQKIVIDYQENKTIYEEYDLKNNKLLKREIYGVNGLEKQFYTGQGAKNKKFMIHEDLINIYEDDSEKVSYSLNRYIALRYNLPQCLSQDRVQDILQNLASPALNLHHYLSEVTGYLTPADNIVIDSDCSPITNGDTSLLRARYHDGLRIGISCLMELGPESRRDAARILSLYSIPNRPFRVQCHTPEEEIRHTDSNGNDHCRLLGGADGAFATLCGQSDFPGVHLSNQMVSRNSGPLTLFHETYHNIGRLHGTEVDVVTMSDVCCFGNISMRGSSHQRSVEAACSILRERPDENSRDYFINLAIATSYRNSRGATYDHYWRGGDAHLQSMRYYSRAPNRSERTRRALIVRDTIRETARAIEADENLRPTDLIPAIILNLSLSPDLDNGLIQAEVNPLVQRLAPNAQVRGIMLNLAIIIGLINKNVTQELSRDDLETAISNLRESILLLSCSSENHSARRSLNRFFSYYARAGRLDGNDHSWRKFLNMLRGGMQCESNSPSVSLPSTEMQTTIRSPYQCQE